MKFNKSHRKIMETVFENYNRLIKMEQDDYLDRLCQVMSEKKNLISFDRGESAFRDFAIKGYLHNLKTIQQEWLEIQQAVELTRNIVDGFAGDDEDDMELV